MPGETREAWICLFKGVAEASFESLDEEGGRHRIFYFDERLEAVRFVAGGEEVDTFFFKSREGGARGWQPGGGPGPGSVEGGGATEIERGYEGYGYVCIGFVRGDARVFLSHFKNISPWPGVFRPAAEAAGRWWGWERFALVKSISTSG